MSRPLLTAMGLAYLLCLARCSAEPLQSHKAHRSLASPSSTRGHSGCSKTGYHFRYSKTSLCSLSTSSDLSDHLYLAVGGCRCHCRPIKYTASTLEREWGQQLARGNDDACQFILNNIQKVKEWTVKVKVKFDEQPDSMYLLISYITPIITSHWQSFLTHPWHVMRSALLMTRRL